MMDGASRCGEKKVIRNFGLWMPIVGAAMPDAQSKQVGDPWRPHLKV